MNNVNILLVKREFLLAFGYLLYCISFIVNSLGILSGAHYLGLFLLFCLILLLPTSRLAIDTTVLCAAALIISPLLTSLLTSTITYTYFSVKHTSLYLLILLLLTRRFTPLHISRYRLMYIVSIASIIIFSLVFIRIGDARAAGIFVNANNFSLFAMTLLFLVDEQNDSIPLITLIHSFIIVSLLLSITLGGFIGYLTYVTLKFRVLASRFRYIALFSLLTFSFFSLILLNTSNIHHRFMQQYLSLSDTFGGGLDNVDFGKQAVLFGAENTSASWRLTHWYRILSDYTDHGIFRMIFGFGIGQIPNNFGNYAHNDYLRILYEQGMWGLLLTLYIFTRFYHHIPTSLRPALFSFAAFSFSENNIDNFMYMSILSIHCTSFYPRAFHDTV